MNAGCKQTADRFRGPEVAFVDAALEFDRIGKTFHIGFRRRCLHALHDVTLTVRRGEILGLLGHNGAGKTTLLKIALGLLKPSCGSGRLLGRSLGDLEARRLIGYVPEEPYHYPALTVLESLQYAAGLSRLGGRTARKRIAAVVEECRLAEVSHLQVRKLSRGWLRRVTIATALLPEPELLLLDEPLSGLDPEARVSTKARIRAWRDAGRTVLLSSHVLPDVELLADRVVLLRRGRLIAESNRAQDGAGVVDGYEVEISGAAPAWLASHGQLQWEQRAGSHSRWWLPDLEAGAVPQLVTRLAASGAQVVTFAPRQESLEDFFVRVQREAEASEHMADASDGEAGASEGEIKRVAAAGRVHRGVSRKETDR